MRRNGENSFRTQGARKVRRGEDQLVSQGKEDVGYFFNGLVAHCAIDEPNGTSIAELADVAGEGGGAGGIVCAVKNDVGAARRKFKRPGQRAFFRPAWM